MVISFGFRGIISERHFPHTSERRSLAVASCLAKRQATFACPPPLPLPSAIQDPLPRQSPFGIRELFDQVLLTIRFPVRLEPYDHF